MMENAEYYAKRSKDKFEQGDIEGKDADLDRAIQLDPTNLEYRWTRSGEISFENYDEERYSLAVEDLSRIIEISSDLSELEKVYSKLTILHEALQQYDELMADLNWLIDHGFGTHNRYIYRAKCKEDLGYFEGAIDDYTTAHQTDPQNTTTLLQRASAYYLSKQYKKAIEDLTTILSFDKDAPSFLSGVYHWRGKAYYQLGEYDKALADFNKDMRLGSNEVFTDATAYMRTFAPEDLTLSG